MKNIAVFGVGHLGKIHCKCINESEKLRLVGVYDPNVELTKQVSQEFNLPIFNNPAELMSICDLADVVTTTSSHFQMSQMAIEMGKHLFVEKPVTVTPQEAETLLQMANKKNVKVQVGHVERFNPAFLAAQPAIKNPMFIETHRLALFNPRGNDVSVVLDLMIHDIDIVIKVVNSAVKDILASGVAVVSDTYDIANARLVFENGCVANLTASRLSLKNMRKNRFFQPNAYISVDFLEKKTEIIHIEEVDKNDNNPFALILDMGNHKPKKQIIIDNPTISPNNAIQSELESLADAIDNQTQPLVTLQDGYNALVVAHQIIKKMNCNL